ncbi:MAG: DUF6683 family protein [Gammaproteobacteria bacterium]
MNRTTKRSLITLLFAAAGFAPHAVAQDYMGMFNASNTAGINIAGTIAVNGAIKKQAKNASGRAREALSPEATEALTYTPDATVSRRVKEEFKTAVQRADPAKSDHIARVLDAQDVLADFDRDMAPYGFRSNNVADAMSAYWITMWMIANQKAIPTRKRVAAVHQQVTRNMLTNQMLAKATLEQRQEMAEGLVYETMFALGQRADVERRRDYTRQRELARVAHKNVLRNGIDLKNLRMTSSGFVSN